MVFYDNILGNFSKINQKLTEISSKLIEFFNIYLKSLKTLSDNQFYYDQYNLIFNLDNNDNFIKYKKIKLILKTAIKGIKMVKI